MRQTSDELRTPNFVERVRLAHVNHQELVALANEMFKPEVAKRYFLTEDAAAMQRGFLEVFNAQDTRVYVIDDYAGIVLFTEVRKHWRCLVHVAKWGQSLTGNRDLLRDILQIQMRLDDLHAVDAIFPSVFRAVRKAMKPLGFRHVAHLAKPVCYNGLETEFEWYQLARQE